jgi:hypothetical protein
MLEDKLTTQYAILGLNAKVKVRKHIAEVEFCSMIFAPIVKNTLLSSE